MDDRIKEHLKRLNKYYLRLSDTRKLEKEIFIQEDLYQASSDIPLGVKHRLENPVDISFGDDQSAAR